MRRYDEAESLYSAAFALAKKGIDSDTKARLHTCLASCEAIEEPDKALALEAVA